MTRFFLTLAACLSVGSLAYAQAPTLTNFGFETPNVGTGSFQSFQFNPTGAGWTFTGFSGVAGNGSGYTNSNPNAPQGTQVAFLQQTGSFSQSFTLNNSFSSFLVSFQSAQRGSLNASSQTYRVSLDSTVVGTFTPGSSTYASFTTTGIALGSGSHTLTFTGINPQGGDNTALIDNVQLSGVVVVPEAGTAALIGTMLPLIGGVVVLRRKRTTK